MKRCLMFLAMPSTIVAQDILTNEPVLIRSAETGERHVLTFHSVTNRSSRDRVSPGSPVYVSMEGKYLVRVRETGIAASDDPEQDGARWVVHVDQNGRLLIESMSRNDFVNSVRGGLIDSNARAPNRWSGMPAHRLHKDLWDAGHQGAFWVVEEVRNARRVLELRSNLTWHWRHAADSPSLRLGNIRIAGGLGSCEAALRIWERSKRPALELQMNKTSSQQLRERAFEVLLHGQRHNCDVKKLYEWAKENLGLARLFQIVQEQRP